MSEDAFMILLAVTVPFVTAFVCAFVPAIPALLSTWRKE